MGGCIKLVLKKKRKEKSRRGFGVASFFFIFLTTSFGAPLLPTAGRLLASLLTTSRGIYLYIYIRGIYCLDQKLSSSLCDGSISVAA
jgi:hypothetical protein